MMGLFPDCVYLHGLRDWRLNRRSMIRRNILECRNSRYVAFFAILTLTVNGNIGGMAFLLGILRWIRRAHHRQAQGRCSGHFKRLCKSRACPSTPFDKLRADAQDIQSTFCTTKGALNGGGGSRTTGGSYNHRGLR
jgi:hypothetical protein